MNTFSDLAQRVRVHLCYAHIFGEAPSVAELIARCDPGDPAGVERELGALEASGTLQRVDGRCRLAGLHAAHPVAPERTTTSLADALAQQRHVIGFLERSSLVSMLAVSGSLAGEEARPNGRRPADLDLFIITAPSSLHIIRFVLRGWGILQRLRTALGGSARIALCPNYVTESHFLEVTNESLFTASDVLRVRVLKGGDEYRRFLAANAWITRYFPHRALTPPVTREAHRSAPPLRAVVNLCCFTAMAACSGFKAVLTRRPSPYSWRFRFDRAVSLHRLAQDGGGYQPQVARRFDEIYHQQFGEERGLREFLFPGTTSSGVHWAGGHAEPSLRSSLGYDA